MTLMRSILTCLCVIVASVGFASAAEKVVELPDGSKLDLSSQCPVCNMAVGSEPLNPAAVVFKDGTVKGFDGARHLFAFLLDQKKYSYKMANIKARYVTDYAGKKFIDATKAYYVYGSDVKGTMGPELVPFSDKAAAEKLSKEHNGKAVLQYPEVGPKHVKTAKRKMLKMERSHGGGSEHKHEHGGGSEHKHEHGGGSEHKHEHGSGSKHK